MSSGQAIPPKLYTSPTSNFTHEVSFHWTFLATGNFCAPLVWMTIIWLESGNGPTASCLEKFVATMLIFMQCNLIPISILAFQTKCLSRDKPCRRIEHAIL